MKKENDCTKNYQYYLNQMIKFNSDKDLIALRERYNEPSFFELISKERSENTFSAFLKWMIQDSSISNGYNSSLFMLLDILVRRSGEQQQYSGSILIDDQLKKYIVSRKIRIVSLKAETEKPVAALAKEVIEGNNTDLNMIASNSQDRIDIFIDCDIEFESESKKLQVIIENKIDSIEGGAKKYGKDWENKLPKEYMSASQTKRYYLGTHREDVYQIYTFLTPLASEKLDNFEQLKKEQDELIESEKKKNRKTRVLRDDDHFVQINYQDILDGVIVPLLNSSSLSTRSRFFIEEFKNELTFPSIEGASVHPSIAIGAESSHALTKIWDRHKPLIIDAAIAASQSDFWLLDNVYYDQQPRKEILQKLLDGNCKDFLKDCEIDNGKYSWKRNLRYNDIEKYYGLPPKSTQIVVGYDEETQSLLESFWDENKRFLSALMNGIEEEPRKQVACLLNEASKRDTTKYNVFLNNCPLNEKPLGKGETALLIVNTWANKYKEQNNNTLSKAKLDEVFPLEYNYYYNRSGCFNSLFQLPNSEGKYEFNGRKVQGEIQGNWDIAPKGKYELETDDGTVKFLKMWRKDALEEFVQKVSKKDLLKGLIIVPVI